MAVMEQRGCILLDEWAADRIFKMDLGNLTELSVSEPQHSHTIFSQIIS